MKIIWANEINDPKGDGYGYSNHTRQMKAALQRAGVELTDDMSSDLLAVHISPSDFYTPIPGKRNLLFTMIETATIPRNLWIEPERQPDIFVVPCEHNKKIFKQFYRGKPVHVCPEGINPDEFPFYERKEPARDEPFRLLFVGALNDRKGFKRIADLFNAWLSRGMPDNMQLYLKTTNLIDIGLPGIHYLKPDKYRLNFTGYKPKEGQAPELPSMVIDQRNLSTEELCGLYQSSHAFILPTTGEGWGLTLHEALATGCPSIWTHWSGPVDFADSQIGYPMKRFRKTPITFESGATSTGALPDKGEMLSKIKHIYDNYAEALERGRKAADRMHTRFTWDNAAQRFIEILRQYGGGDG
ncbi:MAG: glycosyltransferase [Spirochaetota bacterium]|nr:glycosyltransferase [Spirochaetota bacterium]